MFRFFVVAVFMFGLLSSGLSFAMGEATNGSLLVKVIPRGAEVVINDRVVGKAPLLLTKVPKGKVWVQARLNGYRTWGKSVDISESEKNTVTLILARSLK
ncbi:MAG: PEGA domain-containing protein [Magnetococcales bacterium]|nr:PEGA domain-containing protein [Magnetococcales bacterium]